MLIFFPIVIEIIHKYIILYTTQHSYLLSEINVLPSYPIYFISIIVDMYHGITV